MKYRNLLVLLLFLVGRTAFAHGGEDHGAASALPVPDGGAAAGRLTSYGVTDIFEVVVRYTPPKVGEGSPLQFLIADYATNEPITDATFTITSSPSGVSSQAPAKMISPGVYTLELLFPTDTVYNLVMTLKAGNRTDLLEMKNIYSGRHAEEFLAEHSTSGSGGTTPAAADQSGGVGLWIWLGGALLVAILGGWFVLRQRRRGASKQVTSKGPDALLSSTDDNLKP